MQPYLEAVRKTLEAALCLEQFSSQVVERHNKPEVISFLYSLLFLFFYLTGFLIWLACSFWLAFPSLMIRYHFWNWSQLFLHLISLGYLCVQNFPCWLELLAFHRTHHIKTPIGFSKDWNNEGLMWYVSIPVADDEEYGRTSADNA